MKTTMNCLTGLAWVSAVIFASVTTAAHAVGKPGKEPPGLFHLDIGRDITECPRMSCYPSDECSGLDLLHDAGTWEREGTWIRSCEGRPWVGMVTIGKGPLLATGAQETRPAVNIEYFLERVSRSPAACFPEPLHQEALGGWFLSRNKDGTVLATMYFKAYADDGESEINYRLDMEGVLEDPSNWPPALETSNTIWLDAWVMGHDSGRKAAACVGEGIFEVEDPLNPGTLIPAPVRVILSRFQ